jgi:hypothetical protein
MNNEAGKPDAVFADANGSNFLIRWRGRQEGPYTFAAIEAKLAANQIGLLHEISYKGQWITIRDYLVEREAGLRAQRLAREEQEQYEREEAERQAKEREDQHRAELLAEQRRKNDLLQASITERQPHDINRQIQPMIRKHHRAGTLLAIAIIGLFVFGPLCIAAWVMGDSDLREMDAGIMDDSGRSSTSSARTIGILGTVLWIIGVIIFFINST